MNIEAIREAAERILRNIDYTSYSAHCEQEAAAKEILHLLDEADQPATYAPPSNYVGEAAVEYGAPFDEPLAQGRRGMLGWEGMA